MLMMKKKFIAAIIVISFSAGFFVAAFAKQNQPAGYILENEKDIAAAEPGPHKGGGNTTGHRFFKNAVGSKLQFTKRLLHPGSAIGYHLQKEEEIYYIASGTGEMQMNGQTFPVKAGDAILTLAGSSHGLKQTGTEDLVVIINYERR
jgi:mannose-6-phosphate isomerase-like protein (cupin superfamily)